MGKSKTKPDFGSVPFSLDAADLTAARSFGLLNDAASANTTDSTSPLYGVAHNKKRDIGEDELEAQQAIQQRCKDFARSCDFQLIVRVSGSTNAKYTCKRLQHAPVLRPFRDFMHIGPTDLSPHRAAGFHGANNRVADLLGTSNFNQKR
ncbi:unnamed protein product [Phytophthora fragariaefolia]|uniref:Unnamed protein product n=1 Tax=Phytophthora fragariaefolia TaxID=1490495 RepID=A0A9W6XZU2_9STRA|nr:unnamed protein product [Phytophthora fragariaefolia]